MAKQRKLLPARRQTSSNDSLLIRSAESLGRMIGSLQRQLDAARHLTSYADGAAFREDGHRPARQRNAIEQKKTPGKMKSVQASPDGTGTRDRKSKRAAKSAAKKAGSRKRSGARQRAARKNHGS